MCGNKNGGSFIVDIQKELNNFKRYKRVKVACRFISHKYERLVDKARFDQKGRAVVNVRWIVGAGGVIPMTTIKKIILLKRDYQDKNIVTELSTDEALQHMLKNDFCNPHQLVKDNRKIELRKGFFRRYFEQTDVHLVNTTGTPQETQAEIRALLSVKK